MRDRGCSLTSLLRPLAGSFSGCHFADNSRGFVHLSVLFHEAGWYALTLQVMSEGLLCFYFRATFM